MHDRKKLPIIVGGTNYYIESILWNVLIDTGVNVSFNAFFFIIKNCSVPKPSHLPTWAAFSKLQCSKSRTALFFSIVTYILMKQIIEKEKMWGTWFFAPVVDWMISKLCCCQRYLVLRREKKIRMHYSID